MIRTKDRSYTLCNVQGGSIRSIPSDVAQALIERNRANVVRIRKNRVTLLLDGRKFWIVPTHASRGRAFKVSA